MTSFRLVSLALSLSLCSLVSSQCLSGEVHDSSRGLCYSFQSSVKLFSDARDFCLRRVGGGDLASVHDAHQSRIIAAFSEEYLDETLGVFWIGGMQNGSGFTWTDGSQWDFNNWIPGEPTYYSNGRTLMQIDDGRWKVGIESQGNQFVCAGPSFDAASTTSVPGTATPNTPYYPWGTTGTPYYPWGSTGTPYNPWTNYPAASTTGSSPTGGYTSWTMYPPYGSTTQQPWVYSTQNPGCPKASQCPSSWTYYSGTDNCYSVFFSAAWDSAELLCGQMGGHLASIHSYGENAFVSRLSRTLLNATAPLQMTWTGLNYETGLWRWSDSSPVDFINWAPKEPTNQSTKKCAMISQDGATQVWYTADCDSHMRAYVCKKAATH